MKYIKKIILENFQSHKYTEIELNNKLNIIVGPSDSGKTAIMRAIKWALYNEPSGDYFIREGETEVSVTLIFSDNTKLIRFRNKSKNVYELLYNNGEELRLEGFGTGVPEEIIEAIGIYKINLDGKETNSVSLGEQLEGPFLLSEKNSTRASAIGQLVGVDVIDEALREVLKDLRTLNIRKKSLEEDITLLNDEIKTFDYLDSLKLTINKVSIIRGRIFDAKNTLDKYNQSYKDLNKLYYEIEKLQEINARLNRLNDIDKIIITLEDKNSKYWHLNKYNKNLNTLRKNIKANENLLIKLENINISGDIQNILSKLVKEHMNLKKNNLQYNKIKGELISLKDNIDDLSKYLDNENIYKKIKNLNSRLQTLNQLKEKYLSINSSINKGSNYIERFKFLDKSSEKVILLEKKQDLLKKLNKLYGRKLINDKEIANQTIIMDDSKLDIEKLAQRYQTILRSIEKCPLCFSPIDNNSIEHVMDHYIGG